MPTIVPVLSGCVICVLKRLLLPGNTKLDQNVHVWMSKQHISVAFVCQFLPAIGVLLSAITVFVFPVINQGFFVTAVIFCVIIALMILLDTTGLAAKQTRHSHKHQ